MRRLIDLHMCKALCIALLCLSACVPQQGQNFSAAGAQQIRIGVSTRATVEQALGPPLTRNIKGDDEAWTYSYTGTDATGAIVGSSAASVVPIVGPLLSLGVMETAQTSHEQKQVSITFHRDIVQTCSVVLTSGTSTLTNMQGQSTRREIPCGQPIN